MLKKLIVKGNETFIETDNISVVSKYLHNGLITETGIKINGVKIPIYRNFNLFDDEVMKKISESLNYIIDHILHNKTAKVIRAKVLHFDDEKE